MHFLKHDIFIMISGFEMKGEIKMSCQIQHGKQEKQFWELFPKTIF